ncbi:MAG: hypothetical protein ACR2OX_10095 [Methyloligellaceae bacterium]
MSTTSAIPFLRDFGSITGDAEGPNPNASDSNAGGAGEPSSHEREYERGFKEGRLKTEAEFNSKLQDAEGRAAQDLAEAREAWVSQQGEELKRQVEQGFQDLYDNLSNAVGSALEPVLANHIFEQTVARFSECIREMANGSSIKLCLTGPDDITHAVKEQLKGIFDDIELSVQETPELSVVIDDTTISTNLVKWTQAVGETIQ